MNLTIDNVSVKEYFSALEKLTLEYRDKLKVNELKVKLADSIIEDRYDLDLGLDFKHEELIDKIIELQSKYAKTDESRENGYRD